MIVRDLTIRNFAVLNNKTINYGQEAFTIFGEDVRTEFYEMLSGVTFIPFGRNEEQFSKV